MNRESLRTPRAYPGAELQDSDAWLWSLPDETVNEPPTVSELESLPLDKLTYRDAERLFLCLLETEVDVTYAKSYGLVGQKQEGIDVYGRLRVLPPPPEVPAGDYGAEKAHTLENEQSEVANTTLTLPRRYVTLQSKRVKTVAPNDIKKAVAEFLAGSWSDQSTQFYYATTFDFRDKDLDRAIRDATDCLEASGVTFVLWDAERLNELLREQPRLVARFFGRDWVGPFCGSDGLRELPDMKLDPTDTHLLRTGLRILYQATFAALTSLMPANSDDSEPFVVLDVLPRSEDQTDTWAEAGVSMTPTKLASGSPDSALSGDTGDSHSVIPSALRRPRRSLRSVRGLIDDRHGSARISDAVAADKWLAEGNRNLLVGIPGAGKSSLLRFIATDILAAEPTSLSLQRSHGDRLPVWLPFGFLCHHLDADDSNSLISAVQAWFASRSQPDLYPLVEKALKDDRLLLLIDGIDEWTTESTANTALGAVETFLGHTEAAIILTSRPYALARLPFNLHWRRGEIAPLAPEQQRRVATQYLVPAEHTTATDYGVDRNATQTAIWSKTNVEPFLAQLTAIPELQTFAKTPLLLALLARSWQGEPLPPRRFDLYNLMVKMLIDTHPKMRARASKAADQPLNTSDFLTLIQAVAYRLKAHETPQPVPAKTMQKVIEGALVDQDILGYDKVDARKVAAEAMAMAEDEFGLLVPQGAKHVGFIHRVIGDHLAGCHLAELEPDRQGQTFADKHSDAAWTDVLLAALNAQPNKHTVAHTLDVIISDLAHLESTLWPEDLLRAQATWRFIGAALAADAKLAPRKAREFLDNLIDEIETSPSLTYRADLITTLVQAATTPTNGRHLHPVFKRWLDATRPNPNSALHALQDLPAEHDHRIRRIAIQGLHHEDAVVRSSAVDTYAVRYGNRISDGTDTAPHVTIPTDPAVVDLIKTAPDTQTQCAALMALVEGWPDDDVTREHIEWARQSPKTNLRTVALYAIALADKVTPLRDLLDDSEYKFIEAYLFNERRASDDHDWTGLNATLVIRAVTEASDEDKRRLAEFAVTTMRQNPMGEGNRDMCWQLACGPLADHHILRDWVIEELSDFDDEHPLILYNLNQMPPAWTEYQPMKDIINTRISAFNTLRSNVGLTRTLNDEQARTALLNALDGFRPGGAAHELTERFGDDPIASRELDNRFAQDKSAAALAGIAIEHLGPVSGFARIYNLLNAFNAENPETATEGHVVVAQAVAYGWYRLKQVAAGTNTDLDAAEASEVLATYDDNEVAAACMAVPTGRGFAWHIADIIHTWPTKTIDYTLAALHSNHHITYGLNDPIQAVALRVHANQPSPRSNEVLDLALDLLTPLPAELREVLAYELSQSPTAPLQLLDITSAWLSDPDDGVRRTIAIGMTQAIRRHHHPDTPCPAEFDQWRETIRSQLCAYGPNHEEDRQIAWICMLLLNAPELLEGQLEAIGEPTRPGVRLTDLYGNPDELLVELVAHNWDTLLPYLDYNPLHQLTDAHPKPDANDERALRGLIGTATTAPAIAELVQQRIAAEEASGTTSATRDLLTTTPGGIDCLIATQGRTAANLERVIHASDFESASDRRGVRERWAFTRLTEPWDVPDSEREAILRDAGAQAHRGPSFNCRRSTIKDGSIVRAAHDMLYPHSGDAQHRLDQFTNWFRLYEEERTELGHVTWLEAVVLTFLATPATQLPLQIERVFHLRRLEAADEPIWKFSVPLLQRLTTDPGAIHVLADALDGTPPDATSPLFDSPAPKPRQEQADTARRVFLLARALKAAGQLTPARLATAIATLRNSDPRTAVADPFSGAVGPLHVLGASLADGLNS